MICIRYIIVTQRLVYSEQIQLINYDRKFNLSFYLAVLSELTVITELSKQNEWLTKQQVYHSG